MSGNGRRRVSKWDLKEVSELPLPHENTQTDMRSESLSVPTFDFKSQPAKPSNDDPKWSYGGADDMKHKDDSAQPFKESPSSSRHFQRRDRTHDDRKEFSQERSAWDGNGSYGTKMSPGLDEWRRQTRSRSRSPKGNWSAPLRRESQNPSRSRSRSLSRGHKLESGLDDKTRRRSGAVPAQPDLSSRHCRRDSNDQFLPPSNHTHGDRRAAERRLFDDWESRHPKGGALDYSASHDDSREHSMRRGRPTENCNNFLRGKCRMGASCRYAHCSASDEVTRERGNERRNRDFSSENRVQHESRGSNSIPCKFFPAGNCRNGNRCRFSHNVRPSPERNSRGRDLNNVDQWKGGPRGSDSTVFSDRAKPREENNEKNTVAKPWVGSWSAINDRRQSGEDGWWGAPPASSKEVAVETRTMEHPHCRPENASCAMAGSEKRTDNWSREAGPSPQWTYDRVPSPVHLTNEEPPGVGSLNLNVGSLPSEQDITGEEDPCKINDEPTVNENNTHTQKEAQADVRDNSFYAQNAIGETVISLIDLNASADTLAAQNYSRSEENSRAHLISDRPETGPTFPLGGESVQNSQDHMLIEDGQSTNRPNIGAPQITPSIPPSRSTVSNEQLAQLNNLSASLAQLLENGQKLPQLYAALHPHKKEELRPSFPNFTETDVAIGSETRHDPLPDSSERGPVVDNICLSSLSPIGVREMNVPEASQDCSLSPSLALNEANGGKLKKLEPVSEKSVGPTNDNDVGPAVGNMVEEEALVMEKRDEPHPKADEDKRSKDMKTTRPFKFALAEYVKELLKPAWKDGHLDKEGYKTVVKKAVDKVTNSEKGPNIPRTQEKINEYLSSSKVKLERLVKGYLDKHQKV